MALSDLVDPKHGAINGDNQRCCAANRKQHQRYLAKYRASSRKQHQRYLAKYRASSRLLGTRGSALALDTGCRCELCRESQNKRSRAYKRCQREAG
ncbi:hypothetical protein G9444_6766 (plasmid) [Rhodococcus erythropolis]|uniref:Uncharacterized protein n=1 Tax=Rhodococcus erythropolis TaxID=1833 RepID=A0A6G9D4A0_RHOER|nr:hypothetical protein G9444_6766 [Rhodococcus erythropolis]